MDFTGSHMDQDPNAMDLGAHVPSFSSFSDPERTPVDYVKWQGSQTACQALNQLIKSTVNESDDVAGTSRGWQRQASFDQIPGFSLLSTDDNFSKPSSSSSRPFRPSLSRPRHAEARSRSPVVPPPEPTTLDIKITAPFLDKTNPAQFLDMLKGVSARIDENAGVRRKDATGPPQVAGSRAKKRTRGVSLGAPASGGNSGKAKKGRVEVLRGVEGYPAPARDKGKGKAVPDSEDDDWSRRGSSLQGHNSMPDMPSRLDAISSPEHGQDDSSMDIGDNSRTSAFSPGLPQTGSFQYSSSSEKTLSQAKMPPPPAPATTTTKHAGIRYQDPTPVSLSHHRQQAPHSLDCKPKKPGPIPKLHPLLQQKPPLQMSSSSTLKPQSSVVASSEARSCKQEQPQASSGPQLLAPQPAAVPAPAPLSSTPTPRLSSTPSSRPPALGMRRTRTFPSRTATSGQQTASGALPTRQKGFKPPLLSASQPRPQPQSQVQVQAQASSADHLRLDTSNGKQNEHNAFQQQQQQQQYAPRQPRSSNGSTSSESQRGSTSSASASSSASPASAAGSGAPVSKTNSKPSNPSSSSCRSYVTTCSTVAGRNPQPQPQPQPQRSASSSIPASSPVLPEPSDTDPDSSFGDMSFDMDALEETMKMYD